MQQCSQSSQCSACLLDRLLVEGIAFEKLTRGAGGPCLCFREIRNNYSYWLPVRITSPESRTERTCLDSFHQRSEP